MSLFRSVTILQPVGLPQFFKRLTSICSSPNRHPLPVRRNFAGFSASHNGAPMAGYRRCMLCRSEAWYVSDYATGKPRVLFTKPAR